MKINYSHTHYHFADEFLNGYIVTFDTVNKTLVGDIYKNNVFITRYTYAHAKNGSKAKAIRLINQHFKR